MWNIREAIRSYTLFRQVAAYGHREERSTRCTTHSEVGGLTKRERGSCWRFGTAVDEAIRAPLGQAKQGAVSEHTGCVSVSCQEVLKSA